MMTTLGESFFFGSGVEDIVATEASASKAFVLRNLAAKATQKQSRRKKIIFFIWGIPVITVSYLYFRAIYLYYKG